MKFLIVDDDPAILKITEKLIRLQNHEVVCVDNALDAIQTLSDLTYDIMITDATMPAHSGFDLIRSIGKRNDLSYLSIAMLTGRSEKSDIEQAVQLGVQDYIVKPINPELFLEKIEKLTERHRKKKKQKPVRSQTNAEMLVPIKVVRITDMGISIQSPYPLTKGTLVTIDLEILKEAGLLQNRFKALYNAPQNDEGLIVTELVLLQLNETEQKILAKVAQKHMLPKTA
jgi:DNA-binding response OmpR family regulator